MASSAVAILNDTNFDKSIKESSTPVLVDFWATWCGPCIRMAPVIDQLSAELAGSVSFAKLDIDEAPDTATKFGVMSIPTFIVFKGGQEVGRKVGGGTKNELKSFLDAHSK